MQAWQISSFGIHSLEFVERPTPQPGPGEVLVRVRAVSLNFRDLLMVKGLYNPRLTFPRIPCSDGVGEVEAVGDGVTAWKPGDRVAAIFMQNWLDGPSTSVKLRGALGGDIDGMLADYVILRQSGLVAIPEHLSFEEAATLPCAGVTAWNALIAGNLRPGDTVLIQGTGGVSIFALQLARLRGLRTLGISSSFEKLELAYKLGLDSGLNYKDEPEWDRWAMNQTDGEGVDLIVEVGGAGTIARSLRSLRVGGMIAQVGVLSESSDPKPFSIASLLHKQVHIQGIYVGSRSDFIAFNKAISLASLRPVYGSFPWSQVREALTLMEQGGHFGKIVLTVD